MSIKFKALGLGLLALVAMSALAVVNAGATVSGHFFSAEAHTTLKGTEVLGTHTLDFREEGGAEEIGCTNASYTGTTTVAKVTEISITPAWDKCYTTGKSEGHTWGVHENECTLKFKSRSEQKHATVSVVCPPGKAIEITHPNCNITVPGVVGGATPKNQTLTGVVYTNQPDKNGNWITMDVTVKKIVSEYHGGICVFLGTTHSSEMNGSVTVKGYNTAENQINIEAT